MPASAGFRTFPQTYIKWLLVIITVTVIIVRLLLRGFSKKLILMLTDKIFKKTKR